MTLSGAERLYLRRAGLASSRLLHAVTHVIQVREDSLKRGESVRVAEAVSKAIQAEEDYDAIDEAWGQGHKEGVGEGWHDGYNDLLEELQNEQWGIHHRDAHGDAFWACEQPMCKHLRDFEKYSRHFPPV